jgi:hypothetical protein
VTATLAFSLPEEQEEFYLAAKGADWRIVVEDMDGWLRAKLKYEQLTPEQDAAYEEARKHLFTILEERGLQLW